MNVGSPPKWIRLFFVILLKNVEKIFDYNRLKDVLLCRSILIFYFACYNHWNGSLQEYMLKCLIDFNYSLKMSGTIIYLGVILYLSHNIYYVQGVHLVVTHLLVAIGNFGGLL